MKSIYLFIIAIATAILPSCSPAYQTVELQQDTSSLLRNPCTGWGVYDDANDAVQDADTYWAAQDSAARKYASFFYVRWRWSEMEPEEGRYAWIYDENYKKLIQGARDRGLKLCFRIYDNGQDNLRSGTPDYVRQAGAKGYTVHGLKGESLWTPYPDDPVFQAKLTKFIEAFAKEYDDPDVVDFVDGYNLGWWGECHHVILSDQSRFEQVFDWITTLYSDNFKRVILPLCFGSQIGYDTEKRIAIDGKGYAMRRDGLGSMWFSDEERRITQEMYGKAVLFGEGCWWGSSDDKCTPFASDTKYDLNTWRDVYELTFRHAIEGHFNTLDLRELPETKGWTEKAPDLVQKFIAEGGYRIYPSSVTTPVSACRNASASITHKWINVGNGYMPNNMKNWNFKYKPAFALFDSEGNLTRQWVDIAAEPSEWLHGDEHFYKLDIDLTDIAPGTYRWAVAIVDRTKDNTPGILLAVKDKEEHNGWIYLNDMEIR